MSADGLRQLRGGGLGSHDADPPGIHGDVYRQRGAGGIRCLGSSDLYGGYLRLWLPDLLPAELHGSGTGEDQSAAGLSAQDHSADPADLHTPHFFENKVFAVFLAEPISDIIAGTVTTIAFLTRFARILNRE